MWLLSLSLSCAHLLFLPLFSLLFTPCLLVCLPFFSQFTNVIISFIRALLTTRCLSLWLYCLWLFVHISVIINYLTLSFSICFLSLHTLSDSYFCFVQCASQLSAPFTHTHTRLLLPLNCVPQLLGTNIRFACLCVILFNHYSVIVSLCYSKPMIDLPVFFRFIFC
uniref:Uncharacterized protein n=1 Tax=Anopheles funestus TaxID=62324 RepID=A0A182S2Y4_ANOFN